MAVFRKPPLGKVVVCSFCQSASSMFCGRCQMTPYCSKRCQKLDWSQRHSKICHNLVDQVQDKMAVSERQQPSLQPRTEARFGRSQPVAEPAIGRSRVQERLNLVTVNHNDRKQINSPGYRKMENGTSKPDRPAESNYRNQAGYNRRPDEKTRRLNVSNGTGTNKDKTDEFDSNSKQGAASSERQPAQRPSLRHENKDNWSGGGDADAAGDQVSWYNISNLTGIHKDKRCLYVNSDEQERQPGQRPQLRHENRDHWSSGDADAAGKSVRKEPERREEAHREVPSASRPDHVKRDSPVVKRESPAVRREPPAVRRDPSTVKNETPQLCGATSSAVGDKISITMEAELRCDAGVVCLAVRHGHMELYNTLMEPFGEAAPAEDDLIPAPGDLFSVLNTEDSGWYRARCLVAGCDGKAALIDAARTLTTKGLECKKIPVAFREVPEFSCVVDTDVKLKDGVLYTATVTAKNSDVVTVSLAQDDASELGEAKLSRWRPPVEAQPKPARAAPLIKPMEFFAKGYKRTQAPAKESAPVVKEVIPKHCLPELVAVGDTIAADEPVLMDGRMLSVMINEDFAVQYGKLLDDFGAECEKETVEIIPSPGDVFAALDSSDGFWYRARCLSTGPTGRASLLDAPRMVDMKAVLKCRKLPAGFDVMPEFCCQVEGMKAGEVFQGAVVSKSADGVVTVKNDSGEVKMSRWRVQMESEPAKPAAEPPRAAAVTPRPAAEKRMQAAEPPKPAAEPPKPSKPDVIVPFVRPSLLNKSKVLLVEASSLTSVWVRSAESDVTAQYDDVRHEVTVHGQTAVACEEPQAVGAIVLAVFTDGLHHRAVVTRTNHAKNKYMIEYLEYGVIETTCLEKLIPCPAHLLPAAKPVLVSKVALSGVTALAAPALKYLKKLVDKEEELLLTLPGGGASALSGAEVLLKRLGNGENVNDKAEEMSKPEWKELEQKGVDVVETQILTGADLKYSDLPRGGGKLVVLDASKLSSGLITACSMDNPHLNYIMTELPVEIEKYCESELGKKPYLPRPGELCMAQFPPHEGWFRAEMVKQIGGAGGQTAEVAYSDYGNVGVVDVKLLRKMLPEFLKAPALGCYTTINGFPENPSEEVVKRATQLLGITDEEPYGSLTTTRCKCEQPADGWWDVDAPEFIAALGL